MKLQGKTALIAGGGEGIGRAVALALAREGAKTAVADIVKNNAEKVSAEVKALGVDAIACQLDLTKKAEVDRMMNEILARFDQIIFWSIAKVGIDWSPSLKVMKRPGRNCWRSISNPCCTRPKPSCPR